MMFFPRALSILLAAFGVVMTVIQPASARIVSITAPKKLNPGETFDVTFHTEDHAQNNLQYYVIFGIASPNLPENALWEVLGTGYDLVANGHSNTGHGAFNVHLTIPKGFTPPHPNTTYRLTAAVTGTVSIYIPEA